MIASETRVLSSAELADAMSALGLRPSQLARNLLMGSNGESRVNRWLSGNIPVSGPASIAIRLWLSTELGMDYPELDHRSGRGEWMTMEKFGARPPENPDAA